MPIYSHPTGKPVGIHNMPSFVVELRVCIIVSVSALGHKQSFSSLAAQWLLTARSGHWDDTNTLTFC